jgi:UDP-4-amino-4-deoxy-L-arabinose formyltransferase/UDP-glucuronic acid dehydrogenase (UDP-4-keto-hexauronic acid decarboxylating)
MSGQLAARPGVTERYGTQALQLLGPTAVPRRLRIVLLAAEAAGLRTLRMLGQLPHEIVGVVCNEHDGRRGTGSVAALARRQGAVVWPGRVATGSTLAEIVSEHDVDLVLNVHFLQVLGRDVLEGPRIGCFNLHPGPLPRYAGLNVASWAIVNGERCHAVTVHRMVARVDAGPVAYQEWFPLAPDDTGLSVSARCVELGIRLLERLVETATSDAGAIPAVPQEGQGRHYLGRTCRTEVGCPGPSPPNGCTPWSGRATTARSPHRGDVRWRRTTVSRSRSRRRPSREGDDGRPRDHRPSNRTGRPCGHGRRMLLVHRVSVDHHTRPGADRPSGRRSASRYRAVAACTHRHRDGGDRRTASPP